VSSSQFLALRQSPTGLNSHALRQINFSSLPLSIGPSANPNIISIGGSSYSVRPVSSIYHPAWPFPQIVTGGGRGEGGGYRDREFSGDDSGALIQRRGAAFFDGWLLINQRPGRIRARARARRIIRSAGISASYSICGRFAPGLVPDK